MELLPTYKELKEQLLLNSSQKEFIQNSRTSVEQILKGLDPRFLLIAGPCSIHDIEQAKEFAMNLKELDPEILSQFFVVMRVYCEKPRTKTGWKGFLYDPYLNGSNQIKHGIEETRRLLLDLAHLGVPTATEFLDPITAFYFDDLITWGSIGARTSSSQTHRQMASGLQMPIGMKNGIAGNVSAAINAVIAASHPHTYVGINENGFKSIIHTKGNSNAHVVLRGGESGPNFDPRSISSAINKLQKAKLAPRLVIDCSHHNSDKQFYNQPDVFRSVIEQVVEGNTSIRGCMLESHLFSGNQHLTLDPSHLEYGVSITDSCLDWKTTHQLLLSGARLLAQSSVCKETIMMG